MNKKSFLLGAAALAIGAVATVNINMSSKANSGTSNVKLLNIEALASPENGEGIKKDNRMDFHDYVNDCIIMCFDPSNHSCWYEYGYPQC